MALPFHAAPCIHGCPVVNVLGGQRRNPSLSELIVLAHQFHPEEQVIQSLLAAFTDMVSPPAPGDWYLMHVQQYLPPALNLNVCQGIFILRIWYTRARALLFPRVFNTAGINCRYVPVATLIGLNNTIPRFPQNIPTWCWYCLF